VAHQNLRAAGPTVRLYRGGGPVSELANQLLRSHPKPRLRDRAVVIGGLVVAVPVGVFVLARYGLSRVGAKRRNREAGTQ
jgi:hypothetical protein